MAAPERPDEKAAIARDEVEAVLEVRRELGPSYDAALVASFADRIESVVAERVDARLQRHDTENAQRQGDRQRQTALGIVSLIIGIPVTAITGPGMDSVTAVAVAWLGIAAVNVAHAFSVSGAVRRPSS
jgi:hypothetical protein